MPHLLLPVIISSKILASRFITACPMAVFAAHLGPVYHVAQNDLYVTAILAAGPGTHVCTVCYHNEYVGGWRVISSSSLRVSVRYLQHVILLWVAWVKSDGVISGGKHGLPEYRSGTGRNRGNSSEGRSNGRTCRVYLHRPVAMDICLNLWPLKGHQFIQLDELTKSMLT